MLIWAEMEHNRLIKAGLPVMTEILDIGTMGTIVNEQPRVYLPQFQPGATLKVKYDQSNKHKIAVENVIQKLRIEFNEDNEHKR